MISSLANVTSVRAESPPGQGPWSRKLGPSFRKTFPAVATVNKKIAGEGFSSTIALGDRWSRTWPGERGTGSGAGQGRGLGDVSHGCPCRSERLAGSDVRTFNRGHRCRDRRCPVADVEDEIFDLTMELGAEGEMAAR